MVMLCVRGAEIELAEEENFNKVMHRIQAAKDHRLQVELGNSESVSGYTESDKGKLVFKTASGGKVFYDTADVFGCVEV